MKCSLFSIFFFSLNWVSFFSFYLFRSFIQLIACFATSRSRLCENLKLKSFYHFISIFLIDSARNPQRAYTKCMQQKKPFDVMLEVADLLSCSRGFLSFCVDLAVLHFIGMHKIRNFMLFPLMIKRWRCLDIRVTGVYCTHTQCPNYHITIQLLFLIPSYSRTLSVYMLWIWF